MRAVELVRVPGIGGGIYSTSSSPSPSSTSTTSSSSAPISILPRLTSSSHFADLAGVLNSIGSALCGVRLCRERRRVREAEGNGVGGSNTGGAGVRRFAGACRRAAGVRVGSELIAGKEERDLDGGSVDFDDDACDVNSRLGAWVSSLRGYAA